MDFEPAKNVNPFLMDDISDYSVPQADAASSNPFLSSDFTTEATGIENPFLTSSFSENYVASGTNPFADFGTDYGAADTCQNGSWQQPQPTQEYNVFGTQDLTSQPQIEPQPQVAEIPAVAEQVIEPRPNELDLITTSNINDAENDFIVSSDDEAGKPKRPAPPRPSMAKETQDLILSVTGALQATSDHLLDRLPPTRAPSPTAFPEFHSPSPTPDLYSDLLGSDQPEAPATNMPAFPSNDNLNAVTHPPRPPAPTALPLTSVVAAPPRPPPARPAPPKPAPPSIPPQPQVPSQPQPPAQSQEDDMFDLFGTSKPTIPKTKDAILNLYSQPPPKPKDLLSDDFDIPISAPTLLGSQEPSKENNGIDLMSAQAEPATTVTDSKVKAPSVAPADATVATSAKTPSPPAAPKPPPPKPPAPTFIPTSAAAPAPTATAPVAPAPPAPPTPEATPEISTVEKEEKIESTVEASFQEESFPADGQEESYIFGTGPPTAQNTISETEIARPTEVETFSESTQEETHYIFGTKPQEPAAFGTILGYDTDVPIFGTTKHTAEHEAPSSEPTIFGTAPKANENLDIFGQSGDIFGTSKPAEPAVDAFDAFAAKFEKAETEHRGAEDPFDPFAGSGGNETVNNDVWGSAGDTTDQQQGFGGEDSFDAFLSMSQPPPPPQPTPNRLARTESGDSDEGGFNVFIKPREGDYQGQGFGGPMPQLAPPPKSPVGNAAFSDNGPRFNPFDKGELSAFSAQEGVALPTLSQTEPYEGGFKRSDSQETPPTPLFDEDVSQPLEPFPRIHYEGDGWEMQLRQPNKKKITAQRFWKKIFVKLVYQGDNPVLQLYNLKEDKDPFQELPLQACYSVSEISAQQYDQFGKIFTIKLQYIFYKERPGVRPGQVTKAERITNKLSQFAAYAIQGDYQGVKEFGSDLIKLGLPVEHAPQISQLLKLGCMSFEDLKQFSVTIEECLFRMPVHRDRALNYKMEEVQITVVDEIYVEQNALGHVERQVARVRLFFLGFLSGMPDVELGLNDMWRQGKEVVGRHDIIPVVTEEWIRLEAVEFHSCIQQDEYERTRTIKFKPPDACYIELMRFRIRPPKNRELPLQLKAVMFITGSKVELRADVLVPGFTSRKLGQIPCEDVMIRFPIPECWIYLFRVEKHFRYGSVKSAHRRTGKIKGIERFLGAVDTLEPSLMEVTSGQAKYEHQHRAIVWRMPRLPKEGQGAYTTHNLVCRMQLTSYDQIPDNLAEYAYVEFTMPATQASHTTVRSVSLVDSPSDNPPEKYVRQLARHEYRVGIEHTHQEETAAYIAATITKPKPAPETVPEAPPPAAAAESDSDSSDG